MSQKVYRYRPDQLFPNAGQPRRFFDQEGLRELADDLKQHGMVQPIVATYRAQDAKKRIAQLPAGVRDLIDPGLATLMIVAGERRWRAAHMADMEKVPVIVREVTDDEVFELALAENLNRADMLPLEEANAFAKLRERYSVGEIASKFGRSPDFIRGRLALLNLDPDIAALVNGGHIPITVATSISRLSGDRQHQVVKLLNEEGLNAMEACFLADKLHSEQEQGELFNLAAYFQERAAEATAKWLGQAQTVTEKVRDALTTAIEQLPLPDLEETARLVQERISALTAPALTCANGVHCEPGEFPKCPLCEFYLPTGDTGSCAAEGDDLDGESCFVEYKPTLQELVEAEAQKEADVNTIIGNRMGKAITDQVRVFVLKVPTDNEALADETLKAIGQEPEKGHFLLITVKRGDDVLLTIQVAERAEGGTADIYLDLNYGVDDNRWKGVTVALESDHRYHELPFEGGELLYREEVEDG